MLSATVAQNPTMPVSEGMKNFMNSAVDLNLLGVLSTGPRTPAWLVTQHRRGEPTPSIKGAAMPSKNLIVSIPRQITRMLRSQNAPKHAHREPLNGHKMLIIAKIAWPPIQV